jgi:hypothetical protein
VVAGVRRFASVAARVLTRPAARRLLMMAGFVIAGWLLGVAGQAHADTVPGARLPSDVSQVTRHVAPAVRMVRTVLAPARPPAILALPPAVAPAKTGTPRPRTPAGTAGPSRTRRHGVAGHRHAGRPVIHTGSRAVTGASEKASTEHAPSMPRPQLPQRTKTLPAGSGVDQTGVRRTIEPGTARRRSAFPILRPGAVPPAIRTAADEPSFSPD